MLKKSKEEFFRLRACAHTSRPAVYKKRVHMEEKAMMIRNTRMEELEEVMRMYAQAAQYMAQTGNPNQWEQGYPQRGLIADDIGRGVSYVLEHEGQIEAVFSYIEGKTQPMEELKTVHGEALVFTERFTVWHPPAGKEAWQGSAFCGVRSRQRHMAAAVLGVDTHINNG